MISGLERTCKWLSTAWILYTLYAIVRFGAAVVVDPDTTARMMAVRNDDVVVSAVGLTYHGVSGAAIVLIQAVIVAASLIVAFAFDGLRRSVAIAVLIGWSGLWFGNALWLRAHGWTHDTFTILMGAGLALVTGWFLIAGRSRSA